MLGKEIICQEGKMARHQIGESSVGLPLYYLDVISKVKIPTVIEANLW